MMAVRRLVTLSTLGLFGLATACVADPGEFDGFDSYGEAETDGAMDGDDDDGAADGADGAADGAGDDAGDGAGDGDTPDENVPHARGTIVLGETHGVGGGSTSTPFLNASFVPEYTANKANGCAEQVLGCFVTKAPVCQTTCSTDEVCTFNDACQATCQPICDMACATDEVCYFPVPGSAACKKIEEFDGGALSFAGTTVPITLFPPYEFVGETSGALYLPRADITVSGSGASGAGFDQFQADFQATNYLTTHIDEIDPTAAYGAGPLPVTWDPGQDEIKITVTVTSAQGSVGTVVCDADDASGRFEVPRPAIAESVGLEAVSSLTVGVERRRTELKTGFATRGNLTGETVQSQGWLELVTSSSETAAIMDCGTLSWCDSECVDLQYDELNCGACGNVCGAGETCSAGVCDAGGGTSGGSCCAASTTAGCVDAAIEACVCADDPYCCSTAWDSTCAGEVTSLGCGTC